MSPKILLILSTLLLLLTSTYFISAQLAEVKKIFDQRETLLQYFVDENERLELERCSLLSSYGNTDESCNVPACGNDFANLSATYANFQCTSDFGKSPSICGDSCPGMIRSKNKSSVLFAPQASFNDKTLLSFLAAGPNYDKALQTQVHNLKAWTAVATTTGTTRIFPGFPQPRSSTTCDAFDPRLRSWYIDAASGPKKIVIVADTSLSTAMQVSPSAPSRLTLIKQAIKALLNTLGWNDYFAVVSFNTVGTSLMASYSSGLLQATTNNINIALSRVDNLYSSGDTVFSSGLLKAYDILSMKSEIDSKCQPFIVFLSDGQNEPSDTSSLISSIDTKQGILGADPAEYPAIFTVSVGPNTNDTLPQAIACAYNGVWMSYIDGQNPLTSYAQLFKYLARGVDTTDARITQPYFDAFTSAKFVTMSRPFYDRRDTSNPIFAGVVEVDINFDELLFFASEKEILVEINSRGKSCPDYSKATPCFLQTLRAETGYTCPAPNASDCGVTIFNRSLSNCSDAHTEFPIENGASAFWCGNQKIRTYDFVSIWGPAPFKDVACCAGCSSAGALLTKNTVWLLLLTVVLIVIVSMML